MAIHWQVKFRSLRSNELYTVNIYDSSYTGTPVQLTGAARPFETQEDNEDDFFKPVRTQSGYLRIVDTGKDNAGNSFDWRNLMPQTATDRKVTLTDSNGAEKWQGYIKPQTYDGRLYGNPQERDFPVVCPLSVLSVLDFSASATDSSNFAYLIDYIFRLVSSDIHIETYYFGGGNGVNNWLQKCVNWSVFSEPDDEGVLRSKYNPLEVLEEICKFWGWCVRTAGTSVYFCSAARDAYPDWDVYSLQDLDWLGQGYGNHHSSSAWSTVSLGGEVYASENNIDARLPGYKKATVTADIGKFSDVIEVELDKYSDYMDKHGASISHRQVGDDHWFTRGNSLTMVEEVAQGEGVIRLESENCYLEIDVDMSPQPWASAGRIYEYYLYSGDLNDLHDIPFTPCLSALYNVINAEGYSDSFACFRIISKHPFNFDHGVLVISAKTEVKVIEGSSIVTYNGYCDLLCRLNIGGRYWNGSSFQSSPATFRMTVGGTEWAGGNGEIPSNRVLNTSTWTSPYPNYGGYGMPLTLESGVLTFEVLNVYDTSGYWDLGQQQVWLRDVKVEFLRAIAYSPYSDRSENVYTGSHHSVFADEYSVDTIFATDNGNAAGLGIIMNPDGSYCSNVPIYQSAGQYYDHIEQEVADVISGFGAQVRRVVEGDYRSDAISAVTPLCKCSLDGDVLYPVSISHDWRDDVVKLKLIEI